jgi:hypothetical protein
MDMFDPESGEKTELYREKRKFSEDIEKSIQARVAEGKESFPDPITCPNADCGMPLQLERIENVIVIKCTNCGFERKIEVR